MNDLPPDLVDYLNNSSFFKISMEEGEVRNAELHSLSELKLTKFRVSEERFDEEEEEKSADFSGYSLLKTAGVYDPDGVLIWLTELQAFGSWDCDHALLITYPGVTWSEIVAAPTWYINGQWYPERITHRKILPKDKG